MNHDVPTAVVMAGIPATNAAFFHRLRFSVGDPAALIQLPVDGGMRSVLILRDIEMARARKHARADVVACPADYAPEGGLSGDRETATAQAVAQCVYQSGVRRVVADRSLPLIYADIMRQAGIEVICDIEMGVVDRRAKDEQEIEWLREAQQMTEGAMEMACQTVARAEARGDGTLMSGGEQLTSESLRALIDRWLLDREYSNPGSIVAGGSQAADCHNLGSGPLRTGEPVIVDIFPLNRATHYNGDCTRTVVHGQISEQVLKMHATVVAAKQAASDATRPGATGEEVHRATIAAIRAGGFEVGLPDEDAPDEYCAMTHGTGHGIGLDVHEPPLLDFGGPPLVKGDALTIEPGIYSKAYGGVRVEDMVIVTADGCESLNKLSEGLDWT